jgi:Bacterial Ig-like domain
MITWFATAATLLAVTFAQNTVSNAGTIYATTTVEPARFTEATSTTQEPLPAPLPSPNLLPPPPPPADATTTADAATGVAPKTTDAVKIEPVRTIEPTTQQVVVTQESKTTVQANDSAPRTLSSPPPATTIKPATTQTQTQTQIEYLERKIQESQQNEALRRAAAARLEEIRAEMFKAQFYLEKVRNTANTAVEKGIRNAISEEPSQPVRRPAPVRSISENIQKAQEVSEEVIQARLKVSAILGDVARNQTPTAAPVVQSAITASLQDIQRVIKEETGTDVSFATRIVRDIADEGSRGLQESKDALQSRSGLDMYLDGDRDGVSNYDERNIYGTNPEEAYTAGGYLSDGQRILLGLNPLSTSTAAISLDAPAEADVVSETLFQVTSIKVEEVSKVTNAAVGSATTTMVASTSSNPVLEKSSALTFEGTGLPNSFVTLYIFSTPVVVTIKTDANGNWRYTLDTELPDGAHDLYVAMVNNDGRVIARSPNVPFIKQAEAVSYAPLVTPPLSDPSLIDTLRENMIVAGGVIFLVFAGIAVIVVGFVRRPEPEHIVGA